MDKLENSKINIEQKLTQLMRDEKKGLKNAIRFHSRFLSLIGSEHKKDQADNKETTMYGILDQTKLSQSLNDKRKLRELIQKEAIHESALGISAFMDLQLVLEICNKNNYEKDSYVIKSKEEIQSLESKNILN